MAMATIVVVEDEKELNDIMCMYLRDAGYRCTGVCRPTRRTRRCMGESSIW